MIIGLTGGIATGKSTVTALFRTLGAYVVDADVWARRVVEPGSQGLVAIVEAFGTDMLLANGNLHRERLGELIFGDAEARHKLNAITHPLVRQGMKDETLAYLHVNPSKPVIWDVPLLFEGETQKLVDQTIVVYVDEETACQRLMERNDLTEFQARARIATQMSIETKKLRATYVIDNRGSRETTREQVIAVWELIQTQ